jgi:hypothetical protein
MVRELLWLEDELCAVVTVVHSLNCMPIRIVTESPELSEIGDARITVEIKEPLVSDVLVKNKLLTGPQLLVVARKATIGLVAKKWSCSRLIAKSPSDDIACLS